MLELVEGARVANCPNSTEGGCRCPEHAEGLMAHAPSKEAYREALEKCRPRLRVMTFGTPVEGVTPESCEGGYTCECSACQKERSALVRRGVRPRTTHRRAA